MFLGCEAAKDVPRDDDVVAEPVSRLRLPLGALLEAGHACCAGRDRSYDITAARSELGYIPSVNLADGLAEMADSLSR